MSLPQTKLLPQADNNHSSSSNKMALGKSIKMYLTIFVATTCVYMVIYQYHMSRQPLSTAEILKHQDKSSLSLSSSFASYFWAPMSLLAPSNTTSTSTTTTTTTSVPPTTSIRTTKAKQQKLNNAASISMISTNVSLIASSMFASGNATTATTTTSTTTTTTKTTTAAAAAATSTNKKQAPSKDIKAAAAAALAAASSPSHQHHKAFVAVSEPPPLYIITPTYRRPEQLAELTRLGYTLKHVVNLLWLVIEDANKTTPLVAQTLDRIGVPYEYLVAPMPEEYKKKRAKPRGVSNRNRGLDWLRANATEGVFYFADDDNTYDISIFEQMRHAKKVAMWPVGLVTKTGVSSPIIRKGKLDGYYDGWIGGRKYPVDMAGFAVSVKFLNERPKAKMPFKPGYEEDGFLRSLAPLSDAEIELLANECTEILTWHTQTKKNQPAQKMNITRYGGTNLATIDLQLVRP